jgi:hypothetical protein
MMPTNKSLRVLSLVLAALGVCITLFAKSIAASTGLDSEDLRGVGAHVISGAVPLLVIAFLAFDEAGRQVMAQARATARLDAIRTVRQRIIHALRAVENIAEIVRNEKPAEIPELAAPSFDGLAQFCSGWITHDVDEVWETEERVQLVRANRAVFSFLLSIELATPTNLAELDQRARESVEAINQVRQRLSAALRGQ